MKLCTRFKAAYAAFKNPVEAVDVEKLRLRLTEVEGLADEYGEELDRLRDDFDAVSDEKDRLLEEVEALEAMLDAAAKSQKPAPKKPAAKKATTKKGR